MSPEQVHGKDLDARSDLFSLGAVLYEMVTGRKAFDGKSPMDTASSILEKEPESILAIAPMTPASVDHVIRRCLAKDPDERWQTARDLASELEWLWKSGRQSASPAHPRISRKGLWLRWALGCLTAAALLTGRLLWRSRSGFPQTSYFLAVLPFSVHDMALAPNGHTTAVVGFSESARTNFLLLYEVGGKEERKLAGTEGASFPFCLRMAEHWGFLRMES
jgi:serine/threonine protein kinase